MTLLKKGLQWMRDALPEAAAECVDIHRGEDVIEGVEAVPAGRSIRSYALDEYSGTEHAFDWLIPEKSLVFSDGKQEPEKGWELWWFMEDGRRAVFIVLAQGDGKVFDVMDSHGMLYRIHTKLERIEQDPA